MESYLQAQNQPRPDRRCLPLLLPEQGVLTSQKSAHGNGGRYKCQQPGCLAHYQYNTNLRRHLAAIHGLDRNGCPVSQETIARERSYQQCKKSYEQDSSSSYNGVKTLMEEPCYNPVNMAMSAGRPRSMLEIDIQQILDEEDDDELAQAAKYRRAIERYHQRAAEAENGFSPTRNQSNYAYHPTLEAESSPASSPSSPAREEQRLFETPRCIKPNRKELQTSGRKARRLNICTIPWEEY